MSNIIDFHSHILPGIDDGSRSVDESIAMLQMEAVQGIKHVVCTPHFYAQHDNLDRFLRRREQAERELRLVMQNVPGLPNISIGAEVHYFGGISDSDSVSVLSIDGGMHILIEMPHSPWTEEMYQDLERIYSKQGLVPIIAHVDRYIGRFQTFGIPQRLAKLPVLIQANAEFFIGKRTTARAMRMLQDGSIHLLGSDCHNLNTRTPNLGKAIRAIDKHLGTEAIKQINRYEQAALAWHEIHIPHTLV